MFLTALAEHGDVGEANGVGCGGVCLSGMGYARGNMV